MRVIIVMDDNLIGIDGYYIDDLDLSSIDVSIHAVQWYETYGEVEYKTSLIDGSLHKVQNSIIKSLTDFQSVIDVFYVEKEKRLVAKAAADAAAEIANQEYLEKEAAKLEVPV